MSEDTLQKVKEMAKLSVLSNRISDFHEKNLKTFPMVFFNGVKSVKIDYDLAHNKTVNDEPVINNSFVAYYLTLEEGADNSNEDKRFLALELSVRNLFWKDVTVEVYLNDKISYKSKKDV